MQKKIELFFYIILLVTTMSQPANKVFSTPELCAQIIEMSLTSHKPLRKVLIQKRGVAQAKKECLLNWKEYCTSQPIVEFELTEEVFQQQDEGWARVEMEEQDAFKWRHYHAVCLQFN
jgi:hypothetical protein